MGLILLATFLKASCITALSHYLYFDVSITIGLGLDVSVSRRSRDVPTSRLGIVSRKIVNVSVSGSRRLGLVSVSAIYVSCPRPIFGQIVQATVRSVNEL